MRDGARQGGDLLGGEQGGAALGERVREPLVVQAVLRLGALGQLADQDARLVPQVLRLHPAQVFVGKRREQQPAQRGHHRLPRADVVPGRGHAAEQAVERRREQTRAGAAQLGLERVEQLAIPALRQRGVGAVDRARDLARDIVAVLDEQALQRGLRRRDGADAAGPGQAGQAAARQPHDQLGRGGRLGRDLRALDLRQHQVEGGLALLIQRLARGGQRRRREPRVLDVVEADDRDVRRHLQIALLQGGDRAQRHVVVRRDEPVELHLPLVDQQLDRGFARRLLERPLADQVRVELEAALLQHLPVDRVAVLGLGVDRRPADEGDAAAAVTDDEVLERLAHARRLVDEQAGDAGRRDGDAGERQRRETRAQLSHGRGAEEVPSAPPRMMTPSMLRLSHRSNTKLRLMPSLRGAPSTPPANTTMSTSRR